MASGCKYLRKKESFEFYEVIILVGVWSNPVEPKELYVDLITRRYLKIRSISFFEILNLNEKKITEWKLYWIMWIKTIEI